MKLGFEGRSSLYVRSTDSHNVVTLRPYISALCYEFFFFLSHDDGWLMEYLMVALKSLSEYLFCMVVVVQLGHIT
jgi:hypothetical protein